MRRVLVALDLDDRAGSAVAMAKALAGPGTTIRLVHVEGAPTALPRATPGEARLTTLRKHAEAIPRAEHKMLEGAIVPALLEEARAWRADTILVAPRSQSPLERFLMGSVSREILKEARCNVLLARPFDGAVRKLLVCTDMHEPSRLAAVAAARLADRVDASSTLLFAADPAFWGPDATAPWPPDAYELDADWLDRAQQEALHAWLRKKLQAFNVEHLGGAARIRLEEGHPKEVIVREAAAYDLVVIGTHGLSPYERAVVGSVAEHVAARAPTSVLVVKD